MLQFEINQQLCNGCGLCVGDCPVKVIDMENGYPNIAADKQEKCLRCQHCLAICPEAALSILGRHPGQSQPLPGNMPSSQQLETLIKGRRSVRKYRDENLDPQLLQQLLDVSWHAPTGHNVQQVLYSVIDDKDALARFREKVYTGLAALVEQDALPQNRAFFADFVRLWQEKGVDVLFRGAPHLIVATAPSNVATPAYDCLIALSYFELYAATKGVGTVWNGLLNWAINDLVPSLRDELAIPADHQFGYVISFGPAAITYRRTIERGTANTNVYRG